MQDVPTARGLCFILSKSFHKNLQDPNNGSYGTEIARHQTSSGAFPVGKITQVQSVIFMEL